MAETTKPKLPPAPEPVAAPEPAPAPAPAARAPARAEIEDLRGKLAAADLERDELRKKLAEAEAKAVPLHQRVEPKRKPPAEAKTIEEWAVLKKLHPSVFFASRLAHAWKGQHAITEADFDAAVAKLVGMEPAHTIDADGKVLAAGKLPVEAWCAKKLTKHWFFPAAKILAGWAIGTEVTEAEYDKAVEAAHNIHLRS